jgi:hypothetical protein
MPLNAVLTNVVSGAVISSATENANQLAIENASALDLVVNDSNISSTRVIHIFIGATPPQLRPGVTPVEGDLWFPG